MALRIVAFTGLAGCGKSTAAGHLSTNRGWRRVRFAGPLKAMMAALGLSERQIEGDLKEAPCDLLCGQTPRHAMQTIGTEWGRSLIGGDIWTNAWKAALPDDGNVVVDDCRFPNEAHAIRRLGGSIYKIERSGHVRGSHIHVSEKFDIKTDATIYNIGDVKMLLRHVDEVIAKDVPRLVIDAGALDRIDGAPLGLGECAGHIGLS